MKKINKKTVKHTDSREFVDYVGKNCKITPYDKALINYIYNKVVK